MLDLEEYLQRNAIGYEDYSPVQRDKSFFCGYPLKIVLETATRGAVVGCSYVTDGHGVEVCRIDFLTSAPVDVIVSGDSRWGILRDVMQVMSDVY